jgi:protein-disulfide isomerase
MKAIVLMMFSLVLVSCSDSVSKPSYNFKQAAKPGIAVEANGIVITNEEIRKGIENDLFEAETKVFEIKFNKMKEVLLQKLMDRDPKKKGLTNDQYLEKYISSTVKVSEAEIQKFVDQRKIPAQHVNEQIKERIKGFLGVEKKKEAIDIWLSKQTKNGGISVYLAKPRRPVFNVTVGDSPSAGGKDAKVTIVEFSDFQCPFCAKGAEIITKLKKKYGNKIQVAFKNFPLPFHKQAKKASLAGLCVNEQDSGKFWKLHDTMFADQTKLSPKDLKESVKKLGIDYAKFEKCFEENKYEAKIAKDIKEGEAIGVKSTPTFFVNGKLVSGAQPLEVFSEIIDEDL